MGGGIKIRIISTRYDLNTVKQFKLKLKNKLTRVKLKRLLKMN